MFKELRKTYYRHALEHLQSARSEATLKKKKKFLRKRLTMIDVFECLWSVDTSSSLGPVLGPEQKAGDVTHPLPLFMAVWCQPRDIRVAIACDILDWYNWGDKLEPGRKYVI